ncbi:MAG: LPP20 family lipoprotein [Nitrospiraceae bacterium]
MPHSNQYGCNASSAKVQRKGDPVVIVPAVLVLALCLVCIDAAMAADPPVWVWTVSESCTFLPDSPRPAWVTTRPDTQDYAGIGQAGRRESPEEQIRAAEDSARSGLASEVSVKVRERVVQNVCEGQCAEDERTKIEMKVESKTKQTLKGARIQQRWLDRSNCMVWTLATLPKQAVDEILNRRVMLFNLSAPPLDMAGWLVGHLERLLREDMAVVPADARLSGCAIDSAQSECRERANTIYGAIIVSLDKEAVSPDGQWRQRSFRVKGGLRFQDRQLSSFDVACRARAEAKVDIQTIDRAAAEDCRKRIQKTLEQDLDRID